MRLHDPSRPRIGNVPALLNGQVAIPRFSIWPKTSETLLISVMLPVDTALFSYFHKTLRYQELPDFFAQFLLDPETTLEGFADETRKPMIRGNFRNHKSQPAPPSSPKSFDLSDLI